MNFIFYGDNFENALNEAVEFIYQTEAKLSVFKPKSEISKLNRFGNYFSIKLSPEVYQLVEKAVEYSKITDGYFDITVKNLVDYWKNFQNKNQIPSKNQIEEVLFSVGFENISFLPNYKIKLKNSAKLDLGAIAKGFVADKIKEIFKKHSINSAIVDLGGHILALGKKEELSWKVGIQHPTKNRGKIVGIIETFNTSIVTSASYERYYNIHGKKLSHIINPKTGYPVEDYIASVTVIDNNSTFADAISTAFYAMGLKKAINFIQDFKTIDAIVITNSREIYLTPKLKERFTCTDNSYRVISINEVIIL
ncbi:FAD:protein FMN transferase [Caldicellulosiruptor sp. DIB 104C]|uniref:FAD:protein FMN transferase n=1 Tax=Caldicellulosiruptor sp. DIB 104C TaxID=3019889 RepID=UPI0023054615|nr:FAD:protein FMN transferase [Caldicellulosiruptor sp. DIB 104C]